VVAEDTCEEMMSIVTAVWLCRPRPLRVRRTHASDRAQRMQTGNATRFSSNQMSY